MPRDESNIHTRFRKTGAPSTELRHVTGSADLRLHPDGSDRSDLKIRALLEAIDPKGRDALRRVMIHDQRDAIASRLVRYRDERGDDWADIIDMLTMSGTLRNDAS